MTSNSRNWISVDWRAFRKPATTYQAHRNRQPTPCTCRIAGFVTNMEKSLHDPWLPYLTRFALKTRVASSDRFKTSAIVFLRCILSARLRVINTAISVSEISAIWAVHERLTLPRVNEPIRSARLGSDPSDDHANVQMSLAILYIGL